MSRDNSIERKVLVFFGLTASGKSYLSKVYAKRKGFAYFNTDVVRKELGRTLPGASGGNGIDRGLYSPGMNHTVYTELLDLAERILEDGTWNGVVLDGSYQSLRERQRVSVRFGASCRVGFIYCYCSETETRERLKRRETDAHAVSDGTWRVYLVQKDRFEDPTEISPEAILRLDTEASLEYLIARLDEFFSY